MRSRIVRNILFGAGLSVLLGPFATAAENPIDVDRVLDRLQSRYESLRSFSANFLQIAHDSFVRTEERGRLMMKKPGRMCWEYTEPIPKLFVADGKQAFFYVPEDRQVMVSELNLSDGTTPLMFLLGRGDIRSDFDVSFEDEESVFESDNILLRLEPKQPSGEYSRILLEVDPEKFLIHRLTIVEPIGNRIDYVLSDFAENVRIPERKFKFKIPPGTDVIRP